MDRSDFGGSKAEPCGQPYAVFSQIQSSRAVVKVKDYTVFFFCFFGWEDSLKCARILNRIWGTGMPTGTEGQLHYTCCIKLRISDAMVWWVRRACITDQKLISLSARLKFLLQHEHTQLRSFKQAHFDPAGKKPKVKDRLAQYYLKPDGICLKFQRWSIFPDHLWICGSSTHAPVSFDGMYDTVIHNLIMIMIIILISLIIISLRKKEGFRSVYSLGYTNWAVFSLNIPKSFWSCIQESKGIVISEK